MRQRINFGFLCAFSIEYNFKLMFPLCSQRLLLFLLNFFFPRHAFLLFRRRRDWNFLPALSDYNESSLFSILQTRNFFFHISLLFNIFQSFIFLMWLQSETNEKIKLMDFTIISTKNFYFLYIFCMRREGKYELW